MESPSFEVASFAAAAISSLDGGGGVAASVEPESAAAVDSDDEAASETVSLATDAASSGLSHTDVSAGVDVLVA